METLKAVPRIVAVNLEVLWQHKMAVKKVTNPTTMKSHSRCFSRWGMRGRTLRLPCKCLGIILKAPAPF